MKSPGETNREGKNEVKKQRSQAGGGLGLDATHYIKEVTGAEGKWAQKKGFKCAYTRGKKAY